MAIDAKAELEKEVIAINKTLTSTSAFLLTPDERRGLRAQRNKILFGLLERDQSEQIAALEKQIADLAAVVENLLQKK